MVELSVKDAATFFNVNRKTVNRWITSGKVESYTTNGNGGKQHRVLLYGNDEQRYNSINKEPEIIEVTEADILPHLKGYQKEYAMEWRYILSEPRKGKEVEEFCKTYTPKCSKIKLSRGTYYRMKKAFKDEGIQALIPGWGHSKNEVVSDRMNELFKSLYLKEQGPSPETCRKAVFGMLQDEGTEYLWQDFPSSKAFMRKLKAELDTAAIDLARKGERYFKRNYQYYIERDWTGINAGQWWVSDHHQLDVICIDKYGDKVRPWVTAWMDLRTNKMLEAYIHTDSPNSDHVYLSFAWAVEKYGLPEGIYLDNGKDYRVLDLTGNPKRYKYWKDDSEHYARSLMANLDVKVLFAREYNAQAKPIEPRFKVVIGKFSKLLPGYTASDVVKRPEGLVTEIKQNKIFSYEKVEKLFNEFTEKIYNNTISKGKLLQGLSPNQGYEKFKGKTIKKLSNESMKLLYMRGAVLTITRRGIVDRSMKIELVYWSDEFYSMKGKKVYMRRDLRAYNTAYIFDAKTDKFICCASMMNKMPGIATDMDKLELKEAIKIKNGDLKRAKSRIKTKKLDIEDVMKAQAIAAKAEADSNSFNDLEIDQSEIVVTTELDIAEKQIQNEIDKENFDLTPYAPEPEKPVNEDDIDLWDLDSIAI